MNRPLPVPAAPVTTAAPPASDLAIEEDLARARLDRSTLGRLATLLRPVRRRLGLLLLVECLLVISVYLRPYFIRRVIDDGLVPAAGGWGLDHHVLLVMTLGLLGTWLARFSLAGVKEWLGGVIAQRVLNDIEPLYAAAVTGATAAGEFDKAQELLSQGERFDAEHNGGARAVEFGLKKAQLFVKAKDADRAAAAFDALITLHPDEGKFYTTAAEEMLRLKAGAKALAFAERGLAAARSSGNRDLEGHCQELLAAAKKTS